MYYPLAIREDAPLGSEAEVTAKGAGVVSEKGIPAALASGEPTKEADLLGAVEASESLGADMPRKATDPPADVQAFQVEGVSLPADPPQAVAPSEGDKDPGASTAQPSVGGIEVGLKE